MLPLGDIARYPKPRLHSPWPFLLSDHQVTETLRCRRPQRTGSSPTARPGLSAGLPTCSGSQGRWRCPRSPILAGSSGKPLRTMPGPGVIISSVAARTTSADFSENRCLRGANTAFRACTFRHGAAVLTFEVANGGCWPGRSGTVLLSWEARPAANSPHPADQPNRYRQPAITRPEYTSISRQ